jgi:hypothetical protein
MNIYQRMSAITSELTAVAKNLMVGEGRSSYKAVGEADVLAAVKPLEEKHGIYSYPLGRKIVESDVLTKTSTYNGTEKTTNQLYMRLETTYRFVNVEKPDEFIDIVTYGDGIDTNDKAPGKAMTYADKYALLKAYKIITGEDPDQNKSDEGKMSRGKKGPDDDVKNKAMVDETKDKMIDDAKAKALRAKLAQKGVDEATICKAYSVAFIDALNVEQWTSAMKRLDHTPSKKVEDLGL